MAFDPKEALREAGILNDPIAAEVEEAFATLTREETDLLISLKDKIPAALPEVLSGEQWARPEVEVHTIEPDAKCMCGAWSGSGSGSVAN
ncbi:StsA-related sactipeptide RiPP [Nonomuraea sp. SBT364]|uniref:StsA-related sactipeptide RiPP n=1 Tax=Nonomuraea sp. SBT364 TaxID=1580530 RepID=UPI00066C45F4|nr:StsA-related sactipeptide RiPP [Nonomuraea sp. SBT364]